MFRHIDDAIRILRFLALSARPVLLKEVAEIVAYDLEHNAGFNEELRLHEPHDLLAICSSLVTIVVIKDISWQTRQTYALDDQNLYSKDDIVQLEDLRLAHFSVKEWLVNNRNATNLIPSFGPSEKLAHDVIAQSCLTSLMHFREPTDLRTISQEEYPFIKYAAQYWDHHMRAVEGSKHSEDLQRICLDLFHQDNIAYRNLSRRIGWATGDLLAPKEEEPTPLYWACHYGLYELCKLLLDNKADSNETTGQYGGCLHAAIANGHNRVVQLLLDRKTDFRAYRRYVDNFIKGDLDSLQVAAHTGNTGALTALLAAGAELNSVGGHFGTALHASAANRDIVCIKFLLEHGAGVNFKAMGHTTVLQNAISMPESGDKEAIKILLEAGADANATGLNKGNHATPLELAFKHYNAETQVIVEWLLDHGADVNNKHGELGGALQASILVEPRRWGPEFYTGTGYKNQEEAMKVLLDRGASLEAQHDWTLSALQAATVSGSAVAIKLLIKSGIDINIKGGFFSTIMHSAALLRRWYCIELFYKAGAEREPLDRHGWTPPGCARVNGDGLACKILRQGYDPKKDGHLQRGGYLPSRWDNYAGLEEGVQIMGEALSATFGKFLPILNIEYLTIEGLMNAI